MNATNLLLCMIASCSLACSQSSDIQTLLVEAGAPSPFDTDSSSPTFDDASVPVDSGSILDSFVPVSEDAGIIIDASDPSPCIPETDSSICNRTGYQCGIDIVKDNCGNSRTVQSCGLCIAPLSCAANGNPGKCEICIPDTCISHKYSCGTLNNKCGMNEYCGSCSSPDMCGAIGGSNCTTFAQLCKGQNIRLLGSCTYAGYCEEQYDAVTVIPALGNKASCENNNGNWSDQLPCSKINSVGAEDIQEAIGSCFEFKIWWYAPNTSIAIQNACAQEANIYANAGDPVTCIYLAP